MMGEIASLPHSIEAIANALRHAEPVRGSGGNFLS
jgi:hypothetical protein